MVGCADIRDDNLPKYSLNPRHDFMAGRIRGFIKVDYAGADEGLEIALERGTSDWNRSEMACKCLRSVCDLFFAEYCLPTIQKSIRI